MHEGLPLQRIKVIVNMVFTLGDAAPYRNQLEAIMDGLPEEYASIVTMLQNRTDQSSISEITSLLIAQESSWMYFLYGKSDQLTITSPTYIC